MFELLNHLHKRPFQLGKGINKATRTHRLVSKDLNLSKKNVVVFFLGGGGAECLPNHRKGVKKVFFKMLLVKKNHKKTTRDLN
jgi:hypothetical protein